MSIYEKNSKQIVRLHNNFVEAIYSLSVDAKKLLLSIILHMNDSNEIFIFRKDILDEVGIDLKNLNSKHREEIIEELMTKIITIREIDNQNNWVKYQLLMATKYKNGVLTTSVYPNLLPYFKEAQKRLFTRFNIQNIKPLTSIHAIRIYEFAKRFEDTGWREIDLGEFKKILHLQDKYKNAYDFKKRVLEVAKKQISKNTDIDIDYKLTKQGKSYRKIKLIIKSKNKSKFNSKKIIAKSYLHDLKSFIDFLREKWSGNMKYFFYSTDGKTGKKSFFGIDNEGYLYASLVDEPGITYYNAEDSIKKYAFFYKIFKYSPLWQRLLEKIIDIKEIKESNPELLKKMFVEAKEALKKKEM
jgi:hypothetical protein